MEFSEAYAEFIANHCKQRTGERLRRIKEGQGHAEKLFLQSVWWPLFHHFSNLHPEYEVYDYKDGYRYLDFAYIQPHFNLAIEIDGFGSHWRNIQTWQFDDHCQRQNHLVIDGWYVLRLTYNQINEQPRLCQQTVQQFFGRWLKTAESLDQLSIYQREAVRIAAQSLRPITPKDICSKLSIHPDYAQRLLRALVHEHWLQPASGTTRIRAYELHPARNNLRM